MLKTVYCGLQSRIYFAVTLLDYLENNYVSQLNWFIESSFTRYDLEDKYLSLLNCLIENSYTCYEVTTITDQHNTH